MSHLLVVSADVKLTHPAEVKLTHLVEDGGFAADADTGASSGNQGIGETRCGGEGDSTADGSVAQHGAALFGRRTRGSVQAA
ncbi:hypothetical protein CBM2586_P390004 [Cupriavidus phytorum]|uniref:Uncharacterized protein n=2 Tax=Cupriavidus TaxID=106589 RepID=A0A375HUM6_9BURK|nr:hypothetical protein CBM2585_P380002 [Cupriavidus taiwanensis]SPD62652.1 protein of unknown function [Cupriavidus neocaledonicus]SOY76601.1 hypothetical protein CBM2588_P420002 [Cupriavidus taiwanensis]SOY76951.1 hypothetical protein CBM2589_P380003 [Cupriavidus taiwanensis]SOY78062.1 hypothetical protein CBM2586_P390004 [Cupriavidus taiwanensis]